MASGNTIAKFFPFDAEVPGSAFALQDVRNAHPILAYTSANAQAFFTDIMPSVYTSGGMSLRIHWVVASAITNSAGWRVSVERGAAQDHDSDGFATAVTAALVSANGTSGIPSISTVDVSGASLDGVGAGDLYRIKLQGNGTTVTDIVQFLGMEIRET